MPRYRHKKKLANSGVAQKTAQTRSQAAAQKATPPEITPAAQKVIQKIAALREDQMEERFEWALIESERLADEAEFTDLTLDLEKTVVVTQKRIEKNTAKLEKAAKHGPDAHHMMVDEVKIQIMDTLASPRFKKDVIHRLDQLIQRLMTTSEVDKLEIALTVLPLLKIRKLPWGICGLVLAIYHRTLEPVIKDVTLTDEIFDYLLEADKNGGDIAEILELANHPDPEQAILEKLETDPEFRTRIEQKLEEDMDEFDQAFLEGKVHLDLFSEDELLISIKRLIKAFPDFEVDFDLSRYDPQQAVITFIDTIRDSIVEIMTPERLAQANKDLDVLYRTWLRDRNRWAIALQSEILGLDELEVVENEFLQQAYINQMRRYSRNMVVHDNHTNDIS